MAMDKKEKQLFEDLKKRAEIAEKDNEALESANNDLVSANDDANVKIAAAAIEKQNAIDEAVSVAIDEHDAATAIASGRADKSISPGTARKFNPGAYFSECHGGDARFVQNGWFYDNSHKAIRPVNKSAK